MGRHGPPVRATFPPVEFLDQPGRPGPTTLAATAILPGLDLVTAGETAPGAAVAAVEGPQLTSTPAQRPLTALRRPVAGGAGPVLPDPERRPGGALAARRRGPGVGAAGRSLSAADVVDVPGVDVVAEIPVEAATARAVAAGLLLAGRHRLGASRALARLVVGELGAAARSPVSLDPRPPRNRGRGSRLAS